MSTLERYIDDRLAQGRIYFLRDEARAELGLSAQAFSMAVARQARKQRLLMPRQGFYLILRPEDRHIGAPDPARWIHPLMSFLKLDYRVALLRAAAFHGASHQAAMVFQIIAPRQMRSLTVGRYRMQFVYQTPAVFMATNRDEWLASLKTDTGFARIAGVEITLLDCARYFHQVGGINALAQIVKDIGAQAHPAILTEAATHYESTSVRRLGYLLDHLGLPEQARVLLPHAMRYGKAVPLDPAIRTFIEGLSPNHETDANWRLIINEDVEVDF